MRGKIIFEIQKAKPGLERADIDTLKKIADEVILLSNSKMNWQRFKKPRIPRKLKKKLKNQSKKLGGMTKRKAKRIMNVLAKQERDGEYLLTVPKLKEGESVILNITIPKK